MDRLFEDAWVRPFGMGLGQGEAAPAVDVYETGDDVVVTAGVPGVKPEDIDISVQGNILTIKGETRMDDQVKEGSYHRRERRYGTFMRQIQLPTPVRSDQADARFENGILRLQLPKAEEAKPRRIEVKGGADAPRSERAA